MGGPRGTRATADVAAIVLSQDQIDALEARNGLRQFDRTGTLIREAIAPTHGKFYLRPSTVLALHREALRDITSFCGTYRTTHVVIDGSKHQPPSFEEVPRLVEELCEYVNDNWTRGAFHLAAYVMWRLNWIHPFADGNGRTTRVVCYLVLCVRLQTELPGVPTVPELISQNKQPYYDALDKADRSATAGTIDVSAMEEVLKHALASQLLRVVHEGEAGESRKTKVPPPGSLSSDRKTTQKWTDSRWVWLGPLIGGIIAALATLGAAAIQRRCETGKRDNCTCGSGQSGFYICGEDGKWGDCICHGSLSDSNSGSR